MNEQGESGAKVKDLSARLSRTSVRLGDAIELLLEGSPAPWSEASIDVAFVHPDEDEVVFGVGCSLTAVDGGYTCSFTTSHLREGLHLVTRVVLNRADRDPEHQVCLSGEGLSKCVFLVGDAETVGTQNDPVAQYQFIVRARRETAPQLFGREPGHKSYAVVAFIKDCLLSGQAKFGGYDLIPFDGIGPDGELGLMARFMERTRNMQEPLKPSMSPEHSHGRPACVATFPLVYAEDRDDALNIVLKELALLIDLLALHRGSYGSVCALMVADDKGPFVPMYHAPTYGGNLLPSFASEGRTVRRLMDRARGDARLQLLVALFREAIMEERLEFGYFRFWNLLEVMSRARIKVGAKALDWEGKPLFNRKNQPRTVQDAAEEIVLQYLAEIHRATGDTAALTFGSEPPKHVRDLVPIWYRRRNCMAHSGGCNPADPNQCLRGQVKFDQCRAAHEDSMRRWGERDFIMDEYLMGLRFKASCALQYEFR